MRGPDGEPFNVLLTIYLSYYEANVVEIANYKVEGHYQDFEKSTADVIDLAIVSVKVTQIMCCLMIAEKFILGLTFRFRRWREKCFVDGKKTYCLCLSTERPPINSCQQHIDMWSQIYSFSKQYRYTVLSFYLTIGLFCIVTVYIMYPLQMLWQADHIESAPQDSPLHLISLTSESISLGIGWYLFVLSIVFWIFTFYCQMTYTSIAEELLYHIEELHGPWEIEEVLLKPIRSLSSGMQHGGKVALSHISSFSSSISRMSSTHS